MSNQSTKNNDMNDDGMLNAETQRKLPQGKILQPKLRFKGFTDPWQQRKLGEVINEYVDFAVNEINLPVATSSRSGLHLQSDYFDGGHTGIDSSLTFRRVPEGYITYRHMSDDSIFHFNENRLGRTVLVSKEYPVFSCTTLIDQSFLLNVLNYSADFRAFAIRQKKGGTRTRLYFSVLQNFIVSLPTIAEQARIGEFFRVLDDLIAAAKKKADLLKLKKKYYLQAIFSQRLRFKGFTKPWQQRKLEELCIRVGSGGTPSVQHPEYYNGKIPFLGISDLSGRAVSATQKKITQRGLDNSAAWLVPKGSITLAMYASVGKVAILDIELATSQAFFNMVIPEETCIRDFLFSRLEKADICHEWLPLISTGTQPNLNAAKLKDWELKVPSTQERKTIGEFFHALDDLAAALARKIELLERRKTAYLQRLFV